MPECVEEEPIDLASFHLQRAQYDLVIVDCPPVLMLADSVMVSRMVDAVLFVVSAHATPKDAVKNSINRLRMVDAPLIGTVLNRVQSQHTGYYYDYQYKLDEKEEADHSA